MAYAGLNRPLPDGWVIGYPVGFAYA